MPWRNGTSGDALADVTYGYDRASRRTWRQDLTPASEAAFDRAYGYDNLGQVKAADRGTLNENRTAIGGIPQEAEAWRYDEQGNWLTYDKAEDGAAVIDQTRRSNVSNQIVAIDGTNEGVAYDRNGNMVRIPTGDALTGAPRKLVWNVWDQLVEVRVESSNALIQTNAYDGLFRRTTRTLADSTVIHQYYNDQWKLIEERKDAATTALAVYYWGARPGHRDELIRRDRDTDGNGTLDETLWCLMDYFDPMAILNSSGAVQERYTYSAFGVPLILAPDYANRGSSSFAWDFLFHGQFTDAETGYQNYGYRFYVPALGAWPSRDAIGEKGGLNLCRFANNDGQNQIDLLGFVTSRVEVRFARIVGSIKLWMEVQYTCDSSPKKVSDGKSGPFYEVILIVGTTYNHYIDITSSYPVTKSGSCPEGECEKIYSIEFDYYLTLQVEVGGKIGVLNLVSTPVSGPYDIERGSGSVDLPPICCSI